MPRLEFRVEGDLGLDGSAGSRFRVEQAWGLR